MKQDVLKCIQAYCKRTETTGKPITLLHKDFISYPAYPVITMDKFTQGLQSLGKRVIKDLENRCLEFMSLYGPGSYEDFTKQKEFVTQKFWDSLAKKFKPERSLKSKKIARACKDILVDKVVQVPVQVPEVNAKLDGILPRNWYKISIQEKKDIINKTTDPEILKVLTKGLQVAELVDTAVARLKDVTGDQKKTQESEKPLQAPNSGDYKNRLPIDWNKMALPERIDFAKKIQHNGFLTYVLSLDETLAEYFKKLKTKEKKPSISLYVNLFSVPSKSTSDESKALLKSFVDSLNMLGRARLEYVELIDPPVVEIREVRR